MVTREEIKNAEQGLTEGQLTTLVNLVTIPKTIQMLTILLAPSAVAFEVLLQGIYARGILVGIKLTETKKLEELFSKEEV